MENKIPVVTEPEKLEGSLEMIFSNLQCEIYFEFFQKLQPDETKKKQFLMQDFKERKSRRSKTDSTSVSQTHNTLLIKHDLENTIKEKDPKMSDINDKIWFGPTRKDFVPKTMDQIKTLFSEHFEEKMAVYYRWETRKVADTTFCSFTSKGILYFPEHKTHHERFYKLNFETHYDKRTYTHDDKNPNLNPYCIANWERVFPKDFLYSLKARQILPLQKAILVYAERKQIFIDHNELI